MKGILKIFLYLHIHKDYSRISYRQPQPMLLYSLPYSAIFVTISVSVTLNAYRMCADIHCIYKIDYTHKPRLLVEKITQDCTIVVNRSVRFVVCH